MDKSDIDKLATIPVELSKISNVVKNDVVKKLYDKLVVKVNSVDIDAFVLRTNYDTDKKELKNKIPETGGLVRKTDYNAKITESENKIPDVSSLATKTALTVVENKIKFKVIANTKYISLWKSKGLSNETIKLPATSDNSPSPLIDYFDNKIRLKFNGGCLKQQNKPSYTHSTIGNIYIVYELGASGSFSDDPTLRDSLFLRLN